MSYEHTKQIDASLSLPQESSHSDQIHTGHQYPDITLSGNSSAHFGDVYHQRQGQTHTKVRPSLLIPFRRDRDFVERNALNDVCRLASASAARVALVGLGGVGKTQIAIEYAYRRRETDPQLWVFWVHASSGVRFEESYRQIAQQVHIDSWTDPKTDILSMVHVWLSNENNGRWVMVVDNADSDEIMFGSPSGEIRTSSNRLLSDYLPSSTNGSIVITSRSRKVAEGLIEYADDIIEVGPMVGRDATALLSKKLKEPQRDVDTNHLTRLVQELDFMPLAITQAAAYINQLGPRMSVSQYLDRLAQSDSNQEALLQQDIRDPRRDGRASNSIIITWHTSFEHIRQTRVSAARLLALMSLFDREGIPEVLLQGRYLLEDEEKAGEREASNGSRQEHDFYEDISMLKMYSLISRGVGESLFDMHRLVQLSTRKWLDLHGQLSYWQDRYIKILGAEFPATQVYCKWALCQELFPHVEAMISYGKASDNYLLMRAAVLYRGAQYAFCKGQYGIAHQMAQISLQTRERQLGPNDPRTLYSMSLLGSVLRSRGQYEQAESVHQRVLLEYERQLGTHDKSTLEGAIILALALRVEGKYKEAEQLCWRILAGSEGELGPNRLLTLWTMQQLAMNLQYQGNLNKAEWICRMTLTGHEKVLGLSHPNTWVIMNHLTFILAAKGSYEEAEQMSRRSLEGCEKQFGTCHPITLTAVHNLASSLSYRQSDYPAALRLYDRAIEGRVQALDAFHPQTLMSQEARRQLLQQMRSQNR